MLSWPADATPPLVDPEAARRAADEILARAEYAVPEPSLVDRALDAVGGFLGRLFTGIGGSGADSVLSLLVVAAIATGAGLLLWRAFGAGWTRTIAAEPTTIVGTSTPDDPARWLVEAERLVAAGDRRGALRCHYQALVATLVRRGVVMPEPGRTPRELAAVVGPSLDGPTATFEGVWYGGDPVDDALLERFVTACDAVVADSDRLVVA